MDKLKENDSHYGRQCFIDIILHYDDTMIKRIYSMYMIQTQKEKLSNILWNELWKFHTNTYSNNGDSEHQN